MAVRKHISLDDESAAVLEQISKSLGVNESAVIRLLLRSVGTSVKQLELAVGKSTEPFKGLLPGEED